MSKYRPTQLSNCQPNCRSCTYAGLSYSHGTTKCIEGIYQICDDGTWENAGLGSCFSALNPCYNTPPLPNYMPSAPTKCQAVSPDDLRNSILHWTYFWTYNLGQGWMFLKNVAYSPQYQKWFVYGCIWVYYPSGWMLEYRNLPLEEICAYHTDPTITTSDIPIG
ncbi:hypothetical protein G3A_07055 [Bacillus sp. 17376]|nr:hypothetical protein G3A_07055 [Bacillus sp. 17376]